MSGEERRSRLDKHIGFIFGTVAGFGLGALIMYLALNFIG